MSTDHMVGHYRIVERLGSGGTGEVYRAEDMKLGREVALKLLPPQSLDNEPARQRLLAEARAAAGINSPFVATVYELSEDDGTPSIAMEYVKGETLARTLEEKSLGIGDALNIAMQIGLGLRAAHLRGLIHRDLKSSNVMITSEGDVKILDFGLASLMEKPSPGRDGQESRARHQQTGAPNGLGAKEGRGAISGTPGYMSPEQIRGEVLDSRTDIFSFGVVLYEMVAGCRPFSGTTPADVLRETLIAEPRPLRAFREDVPLELESIVRRALEKNRNERYESADSVLSDLKSLKIQLEPAITGRDSASAVGSPKDGGTTRTPEPRWTWAGLIAGHRRQVLVIASLTAVLAILDLCFVPPFGAARIRDVGLLLISAIGFIGYALACRKVSQTSVSLPKGAAFRGLLAFQETDRDRFYGREIDTIALFDRITHEELRFGVLYGDSGCGKTSLLKAGLMPKLREGGYVPLYCRSHQDPLAELVRESHRASRLERAPEETHHAYLRRVSGELDATLVVICDQFEEFFTNLKSGLEREPFLSFVATCYHDPTLPVRFLFSLRSDFLHLVNSEFSGRIAEPLLSSRLYHLRNFDCEQAQEIIEKSVRRADLPFESGLSAEVARDLAEAGTVLPSELQIVGEQLQNKRIFSSSEYRRLGGKEPLVHGYLEDVIQSSGDPQMTKLVLRSLISDDNTRMTLSLEEFVRRTQQVRVIPILNHLARARIISQVQDKGTWYYELMHEYLINRINQLTGAVMDATQRANRLFRQYLSNYSLDKRTRIPLGKLWSIRRHSDVKCGKTEKELFRKSLRSGLLRWGALLAVLAVGSILAAAALSVTEEWEETRLSDGHVGPARQIAFSPDGKWLVSGGEDGQVIVWDFATRLRVHTFKEDWGQVHTVAFSGDGKWFASGNTDGSVAVWDARELREAVRLREHKSPVYAVEFSPDSRRLVTAAEYERMIIWDVVQWKKIAELPTGESYSKPIFLHDGLLLDGEGRSVNTTTGRQVMISNMRGVVGNSAAPSPDARKFVAVGGEGKVSFWDWDRGRALHEVAAHQDNGRAAAWSPDGRWAATGAEDIVFWDASTGLQMTRLGSAAEVWSLVFSPDSRWLVSSHGDGSILVWDAVKRERTAGFKQHSGPVNSVSFSPDGKRLVSGSDDGTLILWDVDSGRKEAVLTDNRMRVRSLAFSPDGRSIAASDHSNMLVLWDTDSRRSRWSTLSAPTTHTVAFSPDGSLIATSSRVHNSADGREIVYLRDAGNFYGLSFSSDGKWLAASAPDEGRLAVWDAAQWRIVAQKDMDATREAPRVVCFSPDQEWLITGDNQGAVRLWQARPLREVALLGHHKDRVKSVAFSPDGRRVVTASDDKTIALWDVTGRKLITRIGSHSGSVASIAFSRDGRIASGEWDSTVRLYSHHLSLWGHRLDSSPLR